MVTGQLAPRRAIRERRWLPGSSPRAVQFANADGYGAARRAPCNSRTPMVTGQLAPRRAIRERRWLPGSSPRAVHFANADGYGAARRAPCNSGTPMVTGQLAPRRAPREVNTARRRRRARQSPIADCDQLPDYPITRLPD